MAHQAPRRTADAGSRRGPDRHGARGRATAQGRRSPEAHRASRSSRSCTRPLAHPVRVHSAGIKISRKGPRDVLGTKITVVPGGTLRWHTHPGPVLVTIASGALTLYEAHHHACMKSRVGPGEGFIENGGHVHLARNEGSKDVQIYATFLARTGTSEFLKPAADRAPATSDPTHQPGGTMPFINVKLVENVFTPEQKREIVQRLTDTMVEIEGENMRPVTWVVVEEVASGDWGIGGNALTTEDIKALAAGAPASEYARGTDAPPASAAPRARSRRRVSVPHSRADPAAPPACRGHHTVESAARMRSSWSSSSLSADVCCAPIVPTSG